MEFKPAATKTLSGRVEAFLAYTQESKGYDTVAAERYLLKTNIFYIHQFIAYLRKSGSKTATIYNVLLDIERWALYCAGYLGRRGSTSLSLRNSLLILYVGYSALRELYLICKQKMRKGKLKDQRMLTRSRLISEGRWPEGGIPALRMYVNLSCLCLI